MKASELVEKLQELIGEHGDKDVSCRVGILIPNIEEVEWGGLDDKFILNHQYIGAIQIYR